MRQISPEQYFCYYYLFLTVFIYENKRKGIFTTRIPTTHTYIHTKRIYKTVTDVRVHQVDNSITRFI